MSAIVKKSVFKNLSFNKKYNIIGDFDFFIKTSMTSKIGYIAEPLGLYRIHDSNFSLKNMKMHIEELSSWIQFNNSKLKKKGFSLNKQRIFLIKLIKKYYLKKIFNFFSV